jgi:hypothetical protein
MTSWSVPRLLPLLRMGITGGSCGLDITFMRRKNPRPIVGPRSGLAVSIVSAGPVRWLISQLATVDRS